MNRLTRRSLVKSSLLPLTGMLGLPSTSAAVEQASSPYRRPKLKITEVRTAEVRVHGYQVHVRVYTDQGIIGQPLFARCRYGICGRPEYEKEWRADPNQAAGGQFIEQGTHVIDLFRWFLGEITEAVGMTSRRFFTLQPMDEDGMALFRTALG